MVTSCPHSIYFFRKDVESFNFEDAVNTFKDWHIVPMGRPVIAPPQQKRTTIDIPGANGILDFSNSLTKYPVFENRQGSLKFAVLHDYIDTPTVYTKILKFLQGTNVKMILEDDPKYYYEGAVYIENIDPKSDGTWTELDLGYDLYPYRKSIYLSTAEWLWDPFNFLTDVIQSTAFNHIEVTSNSWETHDFTGLVDMMPINPEFTVDTVNNKPMLAQLYNSDLGMNWVDFSLPEGTHSGADIEELYNLIFCEFTPESQVKMRFKNPGTVTITFRSGRL